MKTITLEELKNLDSTKTSIKHFHYVGWTLQTHRTEVVSGMMRHLNNWHGFTPENGAEDIETAITELAPELA